MTIKEQLLAEIEAVPQDQLGVVLEFVWFLNRRLPMPPNSTTLASETILARDWLSPDEDAAWQNI